MRASPMIMGGRYLDSGLFVLDVFYFDVEDFVDPVIEIFKSGRFAFL